MKEGREGGGMDVHFFVSFSSSFSSSSSICWPDRSAMRIALAAIYDRHIRCRQGGKNGEKE